MGLNDMNVIIQNLMFVMFLKHSENDMKDKLCYISIENWLYVIAKLITCHITSHHSHKFVSI